LDAALATSKAKLEAMLNATQQDVQSNEASAADAVLALQSGVDEDQQQLPTFLALTAIVSTIVSAIISILFAKCGGSGTGGSGEGGGGNGYVRYATGSNTAGGRGGMSSKDEYDEPRFAASPAGSKGRAAPPSSARHVTNAAYDPTATANNGVGTDNGGYLDVSDSGGAAAVNPPRHQFADAGFVADRSGGGGSFRPASVVRANPLTEGVYAPDYN
jgi:hypothetical protein